MKILIAEDDLTSRTVLTAVLKKQGHEVEATVNGTEAWKAMQQPDAPRLPVARHRTAFLFFFRYGLR